MFKNMRLVILFDMLLNPKFKTTTSFVNIARFWQLVFTDLSRLMNIILTNLNFV